MAIWSRFSGLTASEGLLSQSRPVSPPPVVASWLGLVTSTRLTTIGAGNVVTGLLDTFRDDGREFLAEHGSKAPIGRAAQPREIAEVVAFLASERASFAIGSVFMVDGGYSVQIA